MLAGIIGQFALATIMPALMTFGLSKLRAGRAKDMGYWQWQVLCGFAFGLVAIFGTEFGIATEDATMNVRDAAPIAAGLFFGGPSGIIAGIIGGVERWFAVLWGHGAFTQVACSIATCAAGFYAAAMRHYVFESRKPSWPLAGATGIVAEVLHMQLILFTHPTEVTHAVIVVRACTIPMVLCTGIAVSLAGIVAMMQAGELSQRHSAVPEISELMQRQLLRVVIVGFIASAAFTMLLQNAISQAQTANLLTLSLADVERDIGHASDASMLEAAKDAADSLYDIQFVNQDYIDYLTEDLDVDELCVIDETGVVIASNDPELVGFDMASSPVTAEYLTLLPGGSRTSYVEGYRPSEAQPGVSRAYAGARVVGGFVQVGRDSDLRQFAYDSARERHVGQDGMIVIIAPNGTVAGVRSDVTPERDDVNSLVSESRAHKENEVYTCSFLGETYYASFLNVQGYQAFALQPQEEVVMSRDASVLSLAFMELIVFAILFVAVFMLVRHEVVQSIWNVNGTLGQITQGDLHAEVDVRNNAEFVSLSDDINTMVASLRNAIAAEAARIDRELGYARSIQESALPRTFPPFPQIHAFDIYASMDPAREVGGDFYDFFLVDDHTLGFLVADVSGKGIPAALFMMAAKTELSNCMSSGMSLADAVQTTNWHLCQGNEADMFVTVWAATLNYETGELTYVNAGHNPPLLRHEGQWQWLRKRSGLFLGAFDTARFRSHTIQLAKGDQLVLYTDGVNEAFNADGEQFGDDRLERFLQVHAALGPQSMVKALHEELGRWAAGTEQSDDITILALEYGVSSLATGSLTVPATLDHMDEVLAFVHSALHERNCPITAQNQLDVAIEELFVNVCNYAYADQDEPGDATIDYVFNPDLNSLTVAITDSGQPFNPLGHEDPTAPGSIEEAAIGGLGILMTKRMTDDISYVRDDDKNVIAFVKSW